MSFINKSVNYAQTILLKSSVLAPILKTYNEHVVEQMGNVNLSMTYHIVPNNGKKYYMLATPKNNIESCKEGYDILYFFPDTIDQSQLPKTEVHHHSDFYMEINGTFKSTFLLEGYMYNDKNTYLVTDVLYANNQVVTVDYSLRHTLINELLIDLNLSNLNDHMNIGIHPVFTSDNENMVKIFQNNFIFADSICAIEHIGKEYNIHKTMFITRSKCSSQDTCIQKFVQKGSYADVYNVFNEQNGDAEGILYIKGLRESKYMKELLKTQHVATINCSFNHHFNKWEPLLT